MFVAFFSHWHQTYGWEVNVSHTPSIKISCSWGMSADAVFQIRDRQLIEKYYPSGEKFLTIFPDGTGNVLYPFWGNQRADRNWTKVTSGPKNKAMYGCFINIYAKEVCVCLFLLVFCFKFELLSVQPRAGKSAVVYVTVTSPVTLCI